jgi:hypothetical protein
MLLRSNSDSKQRTPAINASGIYFMQNDGTRPDIETFVNQVNPTDVVLRKMLLAHEHSAELAESLRRENISRSALMPTYDNVAKDVCNKWLLLARLDGG